MAIVTIRPNGTVINTMAPVPGGGTAHGVLSDNSDTSYLDTAYGSFTEAIVDLDNTTVPAGAYIKRVRVRVRYKTISLYGGGGSVYWVARFITSTGSYGASQAFSNIQSTPAEAIGGWQTKAPSGADWTQTELDNLQVDLYPGYYNGFVQLPRFYEVYVDVEYNSAPVTTITSPANGSTVTVTRPPVVFTYSDVDGDAMEGYRVKLFSQAQYSASGFNPNTSTAVYDSNKVGALTPPAAGVKYNRDLLDGQTYRWYVWVYQSGSTSGTTGIGVSAPVFSAFTLNVTPPALPIISASANTFDALEEGYIKVTVESGGGTPATATINIERSQDEGVSWTTVRGAPVVPSTVVLDYEAIPNKDTLYRARSIASNGVASVWTSIPVPVATKDTEWRLRDPLDASRNIVLSVIGDRVSQPAGNQKISCLVD